MARPPLRPKNAKELQQRGRLALYKSDMISHQSGGGFRQAADTVDMDPLLAYFTQSTVQDVLAAMETFMINDDAFVSIGDGINSFGTFNVADPVYSTIEACFAAAFLTLRLSATTGGVVFVKSGQYDFINTVSLPAGVSVMGDVGGTIFNAQSPNAIFRIPECPTAVVRPFPNKETDGGQVTRIYNVTFFDALGDAVPQLETSRFLFCNRGCNLSVENCSVFGHIGAVGSPPKVTEYFIEFDTTIASGNNSIVAIINSQVSAVQQVIDFDVTAGRRNKLTIRNNRFWCSGILTAPGSLLNRGQSAVAFGFCDASFTNNYIYFGLLGGSTQTITHAFCSYAVGAGTKNLVITGNQGEFEDPNVTDPNNRLIREDNNGLQNYRGFITGNSMGGNSDSTNGWFITVGDGDQTVGDVNGEFAIQQLLNHYIFYDSSKHGGIKIYVKPGTYTINDKTNFGSASALNVALIGVSENGNFPRIRLEVTVPGAPDADGQDLYFGHRLENIYFDGIGARYDILVQNDYTNPDGRTIYFTNVLVKNCSFNNCGIILTTSAASTTVDEMMKNEIFIEDCQFTNAAILTNMASPQESIAIESQNKNGKLFINRCHTIKDNYVGSFLSLGSFPIDDAENLYVYIDNCVIASDAVSGSGQYMINLSTRVRGLKFTNSILDVENCSSPTLQYIIYVHCTKSLASVNQNYETELTIENNNFIGVSDGDINSCIYFLGAEKVSISNNSFIGFAYCVKSAITTTTGTIRAINYKINNNRVVGRPKSYGLFQCSDFNSVGMSGLEAVVNIKDNVLDMSNQTTAATPTFVSGMSAPIIVDFSGLSNTTINITGNEIIDFLGVISDDGECCICVLDCATANIHNNTLKFTNTRARPFYGIYVSPGNPSAAYISNSSSANITNNTIYPYNCTQSVETGIRTYHTQFVFITENTISVSSGTLQYSIQAWTVSTNTPTKGVLKNNILAVGPGVIYDIRVKDPAETSAEVHIDVGYNKNMSRWLHIDATKFRQYGYNRSYNRFDEARIMWKSVLSTGTGPPSRVVHFIDDKVAGSGAIADWTIPDGLYWTNASDDGYDGYSGSPVIPPTNADWDAGAHAKHQIIVPIDLPEYYTVTQIQIPIYWRNNSGFNLIANSGAVVMVGNDVLTPTRIVELSGVAGAFENLWTVLLDGNDILQTLDSSTLSNHFDPYYLTTGGSPSAAPLNMYVIIGLTASGYTQEVSGLYFAIPHIKIKITY